MNVTVKLTSTPFKALALLVCLAAALTASPKFDPNWSRLPAGTEIPELRTPTSRTFSNGDGTFTMDIRPRCSRRPDAADTDTTQSAWPTSTGYVTQYYQHLTPPYWFYYRHGPELHWGLGADFGMSNAFSLFDLTAIPDSCEIVDVRLRFYQFLCPGPGRLRVVSADVEPTGATPEVIWNAVNDGVQLAWLDSSDVGWIELDLGPTGDSLIEGSLLREWMTLGLYGTGEGPGSAYGTTGDSMAAHLSVAYTAGGLCERPVATSLLPVFAIVPSLTAGRLVVAQYGIAAGTRGRLALRDVLGRTVKSFALDPSGNTRLDLRGFAPGIYMATLESTGQSISRKLIITAR